MDGFNNLEEGASVQFEVTEGAKIHKFLMFN